MLGYGFMGRAHAHALRAIAHAPSPPALLPRLVAVAGRDETARAQMAARYGFERHVADWRELLQDPDVGVLDDLGPNALHAEPSIAAAAAGRHVVCEKPLGRDAAESRRMWEAVRAAGVQHLCAFNYRFMPANRLAREMLEAGELGEVHHFRARYLQSWGADPARSGVWRFQREAAGGGALGDLASHVVDLARYLVGEVASVSAETRTFVPGREVDDAVAAAVRFASGAIGTLEATRFATGRLNAFAWEVNGSRGSLSWDLERLNELEVDGRRRLVTDPGDPYLAGWWPPGHVLGWEHSFVFELAHFLRAVGGEGTVAPHGATFEDGWRAAEVCDAIARSGAVSYTHLTLPTICSV